MGASTQLGSKDGNCMGVAGFRKATSMDLHMYGTAVCLRWWFQSGALEQQLIQPLQLRGITCT